MSPSTLRIAVVDEIKWFASASNEMGDEKKPQQSSATAKIFQISVVILLSDA